MTPGQKPSDEAYARARRLLEAHEDELKALLAFCRTRDSREEGRTGISFHETYAQTGVSEVGRSAADYIQASPSTHAVYFLDLPTGSEMHRFLFRPVHRAKVSLYQVTGLRP